MGISPNYWGRQGWHFIHYVALNYPIKPTNEDKDNYMKFLESLEHILPCPSCAYHFKVNMDKHPPNLNDKMSFFNWTVDMHNFVNKDNGKKVIKYDEALSEVTKNPNYLKNAFVFSFLLTATIFIGVKFISKIGK